MSHNLFNSLQEFKLASGATGRFYSLPALEAAGVGKVSRLPVSIRIVLESVLRNCDGKKVGEEHVKQLAGWGPTAARTDEIIRPFAGDVSKALPAPANPAGLRESNPSRSDGHERRP